MTHLFLILLFFSAQVFAAAPVKGKYFDRMITVIFENKNYADVMNRPFFKKLSQDGAHFSNFMAITHPSQPNYFALTSGSVHKLKSNDTVNLEVTNIVDLLETKGVSWTVYAEDYPSDCFTGSTHKDYTRKHNPFISYVNIQKNPARCSRIVNADKFDRDAAKGNLAGYIFYIPNNKNNGHDTSSAFADHWYSKKFKKYVNDSRFMKKTVLVTTFDESEQSAEVNQIYTSIVGPQVKKVEISERLTLYSLLKLVEDNWELGNLGREDAAAEPIPNIWKK